MKQFPGSFVKMTSIEYHKVFVPFPDIFALSGSDVFRNLSRDVEGERNLVVVPMPMISWLDELKEGENSVGAGDALEYLKNAQVQRISSEEGIAISRVADGLDIAFVDDPDLPNEEFIAPLEGKIRTLWSSHDGDERPILVTSRDSNHIRFSVKGMRVEEPHFLQVNADIVNEGIINGSADLEAKLYESPDPVPLEIATELQGTPLRLNQFIRFTGGGGYHYARVMGTLQKNKAGTRILGIENRCVKNLSPSERDKIHVKNHFRDNVLGITPRDMEQYLALQYGLLNPDIALFFLCGSQGSGKTLLGYVAAVDMVLQYDKEQRKLRGQEEGKGGFFKQIVLLKPNEILGGSRRDVGALPGSLYDKLKPHLAPYIDAHKESILGNLFSFDEMLRHPKFPNDFGEPRSIPANQARINNCAHLPSHAEVVEMTYSGFLRGRSFRDTLIIIDEAQNFTPYEVKTILERMGDGCKGIVMGDPSQVDNPFCSIEINGLTHAIRHYLERPYTALVALTRNYRNQVSDDARTWKVFSQ